MKISKVVDKVEFEQRSYMMNSEKAGNKIDNKEGIDKALKTQIKTMSIMKPRVTSSFPLKLHLILQGIEKEGLSHIISWNADGLGFMVHKPSEVVDKVLPRLFRQKSIASFQRQLNLYSFKRVKSGYNKGTFQHKFFIRGKPKLAYRINRTPIKGNGKKGSRFEFKDCKDFSMKLNNLKLIPLSNVQFSPDSSALSPLQRLLKKNPLQQTEITFNQLLHLTVLPILQKSLADLLLQAMISNSISFARSSLFMIVIKPPLNLKFTIYTLQAS